MIAKDQLFRIPFLGAFINAVGAVPIKRYLYVYTKFTSRSCDYEGKRQDNTEIFEQLYKALEKGDSIAIFPEGTTVFEPHLVPIKTGAARIALGFSGRYHKSVFISNSHLI
jgi:glycerol-3-phosphate O-acyltransferase/dihydroxyacetone phosphate acyltransferase